MTSDIQTEIEARLARAEPEIEVLLAELVRETVRVYIDHPEGVTLPMCERVSGHLSDLRDRYALEVSSPGAERPLSRPAHFRRFIGRRARVRMRTGAHPSGGPGQPRPRRSYTGELVGASDSEVTLAADTGVVTIAYDDILRSNLVSGE